MIDATGIPFKSFVQSEYCFQCKECCAFKDGEALWRPLMPQEERLRSCLDDPQRSYDNGVVGPDGFVHTVCESGDGNGHCVVFNRQNFQCERYPTRPFECLIYPFMIVEKDGKMFLTAHLGCKYVQEHWRDESFDAYVEYFISYLEQPRIKNFLERNRHLARPLEDKDQFDFLYEFDFDGSFPGCSLIEHSEHLRKKFLEAGIKLSLHTFPGIAVWDTIFSFDIREIDGMTCIFASDRATTFMFLPPLGKGDVAAVSRKCFEIMERVNVSPGISRIDNVPDHYVRFYPEGEYCCAYKTDEYLYNREDIAGYVGNAYKSKRWEYNRFVRLYPTAKFLPFKPDMAEECLEVFDRWVRQKPPEASDEAIMMRHEARAYHRVMLAQPEALGYIGRVVRVDGKIAGYTFGYPVDDQDFCIFAEITDRDYKGLPAYIFREFCRDEAVVSFERVNVMDAFALPSIEQTKHSFRPAQTLPIYMVYKMD